MIEIKAKADSIRHGCDVSISINGKGVEILEEALAVVQGVMGSLKNESLPLHILAIEAIANDPKILLGDETEDDGISINDMAHIKFVEGVN